MSIAQEQTAAWTISPSDVYVAAVAGETAVQCFQVGAKGEVGKKPNIFEVSQIFQILTWEMFLAVMFIKESLKPQEEQNSSEMSSWACKWPGKACETGTALIF